MTDIETRDIPLSWNVFVTPGIPQSITSDLPPGTQQWMWSPISATLISGQRDAALFDAVVTVAPPHTLGDRVESDCQNRPTNSLTHAHRDPLYRLRREWIAARDTMESLHPRAVIAGHKRRGNDDRPRIMEETRQYIRAFDRLTETTTARELNDQMLSLYPERVNPGILWASARAVKG